MSDLIEEAIREHWGERCPDFEPGCPCCRAWAEFDKTERLRAALREIAGYSCVTCSDFAWTAARAAPGGE